MSNDIEGKLLLESIIFCVFFVADDLFLLETIPLQAHFDTTTGSKLPTDGVERSCVLVFKGNNRST